MSDATPPPTPKPLTAQQRYEAALAALPTRRRKFVVEYLRDLNGTRAALRAGYAPASASVQASQILSILKVQEAITAGMELYAMGSGEVLARMTRIARGSIADVLALPDANTAGPGYSWAIDLVKAQETGAIDLVRKIKEGEHGPEVELYSAFDALVKLGEHHKLWGKGADLLKLIDLSRLSDTQLERLAEGEDPIKVLLG